MAGALGAGVRESDIIVLSGGMEAGKTAFAQSFGRALGVTEPITSPTFTLVHSYDCGKLTMHHADLYRLERTAEVADLDQRLAALQDKRQFISAEKLNRMPSIELLDEVTRRLPDSSWLLQFTFREEDLRVAGYADDPSQLIRLLEQSPVLSDVRFASPVTRDPRVEKDRFNLSAHVALRRER